MHGLTRIIDYVTTKKLAHATVMDAISLFTERFSLSARLSSSSSSSGSGSGSGSSSSSSCCCCCCSRRNVH